MKQSELYEDILKKDIGEVLFEEETDKKKLSYIDPTAGFPPFANICIDGSLFADSAIDSTIRMIDELQQRGFKFHIVDSLYELIEDVDNQEGRPVENGESMTLDFFSGKSSFDSLLNNLNRIQELDITVFDASEYVGEEYYKIYDEFRSTLPTPDSSDDYQSSYRKEGHRLADIIFEEFIFGISMSPILSRIKKTVNRLSEAADYRVEVSGEYLKKFIMTILEDYSEKKDAMYEELRRLKQRSRHRHEQEPDEPVREIAVLREVVKDYPDTNWISYLLKTGPTAMGATAGAAIGGVPGAMVGAGGTGVVGHYFADP